MIHPVLFNDNKLLDANSVYLKIYIMIIVKLRVDLYFFFLYYYYYYYLYYLFYCEYNDIGLSPKNLDKNGCIFYYSLSRNF